MDAAVLLKSKKYGYLASLYFPPVANLLSLPIILTHLTIGEFGKLSYYLAFAAILSAISGLGLAEAGLYYSGSWKGGATRIPPQPSINFLLTLQVFTCFPIIFFLFFLLTPSYLRDHGAIGIVAVTAGLLLVANVLRNCCLGLGTVSAVSLERASSSIIRILSLVALSAFDEISLSSVLEVQLLIAVISVVWLSVALVRHLGRLALTFSTNLIYCKEIMKFSLKQAPASLLGPLLSRLDQFILGHISTTRSLGVYSAAVSASEGLVISTGGLRDLTTGQQSRKLDLQLIRSNARLAVWISLAFSSFGGLALIIARILLNNLGYGEVITPLLILSFAGTVGAPGSIAGAVLVGRGKPAYRSLSLGIGLGIDMILLFWLAPSTGEIGAAVATTLSGLSAGVSNIYFCSKYLGIHWRNFYPSWAKRE